MSFDTSHPRPTIHSLIFIAAAATRSAFTATMLHQYYAGHRILQKKVKHYSVSPASKVNILTVAVDINYGGAVD